MISDGLSVEYLDPRELSRESSEASQVFRLTNLMSPQDDDAVRVLEISSPYRKYVLVALTGNWVTGSNAHPSWWYKCSDKAARSVVGSLRSWSRTIRHYVDHKKGRVIVTYSKGVT